MSRSSLGKKGLVITNGVGIIDLDYKNEIKILIHNTTQKEYTIEKYQRIAQIILLKHECYLWNRNTKRKNWRVWLNRL